MNSLLNWSALMCYYLYMRSFPSIELIIFSYPHFILLPHLASSEVETYTFVKYEYKCAIFIKIFYLQARYFAVAFFNADATYSFTHYSKNIYFAAVYFPRQFMDLLRGVCLFYIYIYMLKLFAHFIPGFFRASIVLP